MNVFNLIKDIFAPKRCYVCNINWQYLCQQCLKKIWYFESSCYVCKQKSKNFETHFYCENDFIFYDKIIILTHYKNKYIKKLIKHAKFYHRFEIFNDLSFYLSKTLLDNLEEKIEDCLFISTPMYFLKKIIRWYNQSELLIKALNKNIKIDYNFNILKKIKNTKPQSHLSKTQRIDNLRWKFKINLKEIKKYKNKTIIIVDDVISTWTTINELSKILKQNWVKKVIWLCIASGN